MFVILKFVGIMMMISGVIGFVWGDKVITKSEGFVDRAFSAPKGWMKYLKWVYGVGLLLMGIGVFTIGVTEFGQTM
ncbi:hypothetical protein [Pseudomonas sp.]|uniref:hypothetical protein n=1 Tax=Pseudomonas sp. TaxID=306 RepID=UPI002600951D|nr:hypothetical protein [Pseudomonas sp.]